MYGIILNYIYYCNENETDLRTENATIQKKERLLDHMDIHFCFIKYEILLYGTITDDKK